MNTPKPSPPDLSSAALFSVLEAVLTDGQEVEMVKNLGKDEGYCVTISGDWHYESRNRPTLAEAIGEVTEKYVKGLDGTLDDEIPLP